QNLSGPVNEDEFINALKKAGVAIEDARSLFVDLERPVNRLNLIKGLKENLDIANQLDAAAQASIKYKKSLTDLNRTIGTLTAISASDTRAQIGAENNAFSVNQNG